MAPNRTSYTYIVTVTTDTVDHAVIVMQERLAHDEDYGFDYEVGWEDREA